MINRCKMVSCLLGFFLFMLTYDAFAHSNAPLHVKPPEPIVPGKSVWRPGLPKERIHMFIEGWARGDLDQIASVLAPDVVMDVKGVGLFNGPQMVLAYLSLTDVSRAEFIYFVDLLKVEIMSEGKEAMAKMRSTAGSPLFPPNFPSSSLTSESMFHFTFDPYFRIKRAEFYPDPAMTILAFRLAIQLAMDVPGVCHRIQTSCTGSNQQYADEASCVSFMSTLRLVDPDNIPRLTGNSIVCRAVHEGLALTYPNDHCRHTGMQRIDLMTTPCQDF